MFPRQAAAASPENLVEMQILGLHPRPTGSQSLRVERPSDLYWSGPPGDPDALSPRTTDGRKGGLEEGLGRKACNGEPRE